MKFYSDVTKQLYGDSETCLAAETEYQKQLDTQKAAAQELSKNKKARADAVVAAYKEVQDSEKKYLDLRNDFVKDYGYFHMTYKDSNALPFDGLFDMLRLF